MTPKIQSPPTKQLPPKQANRLQKSHHTVIPGDFLHHSAKFDEFLKIVSLFIFLIMTPIFVSARTYNSSTSVAGNYMLGGDFQDSYDKY
ncbi:MAG: hypothetical protein II294_03910, partial [Muribaculaceae bacterium]|nr:hypothetical protein [Muribaculaceae bacterium]